MVVPALEIVITNIGDATIDDECSEAGKRWIKPFLDGSMSIPGVNFAAWGRSYKYPDIAMHFIDYDTRRQHDVHKRDDIGGPIPNPLKPIMDAKKTDLYVIYPNTPDRRVFYAPQTNVVLFYGIDEDKFAAKAPEFFTAIAKSDSCIGYIWGEVQPSALSDTSENLKLGKCGIMISGWKSREEHDRDVNKPRVKEAYAAMQDTVKRTDTWGMQVTVIESNGHIHKWRRLALNDRSKNLPAAGNH